MTELMTKEAQAKSLIAEALTRRLESTYADFIEKEKGFDALPFFFRNYLYSPKDKEKRDVALEKLYLKLRSITGPQMTERVHQLILLNQYTDKLDLGLVQVLLNGPWKHKKKLDGIKLSQEQLEWAIKKAGQIDERKKQVEMVCESLDFFFSLSRLPMTRLVIAPIKVAASMVGAGDLTATMEAGYELSRKIKNIKKFIEAFRTREKKNLQAIASIGS